MRKNSHRVKPTIRIMVESDFPCLDEFMYQAIYLRQGETPPQRDIIFKDEIYIYIQDFGKKEGDFGIVAECEGRIIGAAWSRLISGYGHSGSSAPEIAISVLSEFRGQGIGTKLILRLLNLLIEKGYAQTSLTVQVDNPALHLYQRLGFIITEKIPDPTGHDDYLMIKNLSRRTKGQRQSL